jgi:hypothetical protein
MTARKPDPLSNHSILCEQIVRVLDSRCSVEPAHLLPAEVLAEIKFYDSPREQKRGKERLSMFLFCKWCSFPYIVPVLRIRIL